MEASQLQTLTRLIVRQRVRLMVNQYQIHAAGEDGAEGELIAFAQQKRMAFKEQFTLYTDDSKQETLLSMKARQVIDLGSTFDVSDASGAVIGSFRKDFGKSLLRSTWHLEQPELGNMTGEERSQGLALLRRAVDLLLDFPWIPYHFDFSIGDKPAFAVEKGWGLRDRYSVSIQEPRLDRRLVIAMAVALDAMQAR